MVTLKVTVRNDRLAVIFNIYLAGTPHTNHSRGVGASESLRTVTFNVNISFEI